MKNTFSKKPLGLAVTCALALSFVSGAAQAQMGSTSPDNDRQLWTESTRTTIWRNPQGLCWQSPYGPPPGYNECNPAPVAQYVAPTPAPYVAPVVVAAAPQPVYEKVILDANVLFDFDKSALRPAGRDTLDNFIGSTKGIGFGTIKAIG